MYKTGALLFLCYCWQITHGQQYNFDYYNNNNGLINNEIRSILQSSQGVLYFGTPSGLSIYDGNTFTNYDYTKGFHHEIISDIREYPGNEILFFTNTEAFYRLKNYRLSAGIANYNTGIKNIYPVSDGKWFACTDRGLFLFDNGKMDKLPLYPTDSFPLINCVIQCNDSLLLVGRNYRTLDLYNMHTWKCVHSSSEKVFVRSLFKDAEGNVWISCIEKGVLFLSQVAIARQQVDPVDFTARYPSYQHTEFRAVVQDHSGCLWMGSIGKGIIKYDPATKELLPVKVENGLVSNTVFSLYCDKEDNIWIGTNRGLQKLVHKNTLSYSSRNGLPADIVYGIQPLPDDHLLSCGTAGIAYIGRYGQNITTWRPLPIDEYFFQFARLRQGYYTLSNKQLLELAFAKETVTAKHTYDLPGHFRNMVEWEEDKILLGGDSSIAVFEKGQVQEITREKVDLIMCVCLDVQGILWTGNRRNEINGYRLYRDGSRLRARHLCYYKGPRYGVNDAIFCITSNKNNRVFYGTTRGGIYELSFTGNRLLPVRSINQASGLSGNNIYSFFWENDTALLVGTGHGLDKIVFTSSRATPSIYTISTYFNLAGSVYYIREDKAGNMLAGTESGLYKLPRINIEKAVAANLPIIISRIGLPDYPDSIIDPGHPLDLDYKNSAVSISFVSPTFRNENKTQYMYRLEGSNQKNWSPPTLSHQVSFYNLAPGKYRFMVKAVNIYGKISDQQASCQLIIHPAFWQASWFYFLSIILAGILIYFLVRRRINIIRRESSFMTKIAETEMIALRAQMNPHFIFNCMNIIDGLISDDRKKEAKDFLQKFSKLVRLVLENSQYPLVTLEQDLKALKLYVEMEAIRYDHRFEYQFDIASDLLDGHFRIPPLLLQPYVENAIIHGLRHKESGSGKLLVSMKNEGNLLAVTIEDNGIGRARSSRINDDNRPPHQHMGMKVTGKRIELLEMMSPGKIQVSISDLQPGEDAGTRVRLLFG